MKKKFFGFLLTLCMVLGLMPATMQVRAGESASHQHTVSAVPVIQM